MSCSNCYNGCGQVISDRCVKYTGIDVPILGISNGDSLSFVEQALVTFLVSTLNGVGIKPNIPNEIICQLISQYLPTCGEISIVDVCTAIIKGVCELQTQVNTNTGDIVIINEVLTALNADYTIDCLDGVTSSSDTHEIVQATINKLCAFIVAADSTYVKNTELCTLVEACLSSGSSLYSKNMVPYVAYEYYGSITGFDISGAGTGDWQDVYLCNGNNGTPDKRGRIAVGVTTGMGGPTLSPIVAPGGLNPNYTIASVTGANGVALTTSQLATHTHDNTATSIVIEPNNGQGHNHASGSAIGVATASGSSEFVTFGGTHVPPEITADQWTAKTPSGVSVTTTMTNASVGLGEQHSNVQPGIGCFYIMHIPA